MTRRVKETAFVRAALDQIAKEKASGRTPEQSNAKRMMDFDLWLAEKGQDLRRPLAQLIPGLIESAALGREWLSHQIQESSDEEHRTMFATMHFALGVLMESVSLNEKAKETQPREQGPSVDELCSSCRTRIERRYFPHESKARPNRLYFPVGQRRNFRANMIRAAWQTAQENNIFLSRGSFARYASRRVHQTERWILKRIESKSERG